jgi:hypothetical protein
MGGALYLAVDWGAGKYTSMEKDLEDVRSRDGGFESTVANYGVPRPGSSGGAYPTPEGVGASQTPSLNLAVKPTAYSNVVVCIRSLDAFSPTNSAQRIGAFRAKTLLILGSKDPVTEMVLVTHRSQSGIEMRAKCRASEVGR